MKRCIALIIFILILPHTSYCKTLKIGISFFDPPFIFQLDKKHFSGFDMAMMHYLCKKLEYQCQFIPFPKEQLLTAVANGTIDLAVNDLIPIHESHVKVVYSTPYLIDATRIIKKASLKKDEFQLASLNNKKIGISNHIYAHQIWDLKITNPKIIPFLHDNEMIDALNKGQIKFALIDAHKSHYWMNNSSKTLIDYECPLKFESKMAIAISPSNLILLTQINKALADYHNSKQFIEDYHKFLLRI